VLVYLPLEYVIRIVEQIKTV